MASAAALPHTVSLSYYRNETVCILRQEQVFVFCAHVSQVPCWAYCYMEIQSQWRAASGSAGPMPKTGTLAGLGAQCLLHWSKTGESASSRQFWSLQLKVSLGCWNSTSVCFNLARIIQLHVYIFYLLYARILVLKKPQTAGYASAAEVSVHKSLFPSIGDVIFTASCRALACTDRNQREVLAVA